MLFDNVRNCLELGGGGCLFVGLEGFFICFALFFPQKSFNNHKMR